MWTSRGFQELRLIQKGELFEKFRTSHGAYLPRELNDFRLFLELIQRDGNAPAEKEKTARLFEHILPATSRQQTPLNVARSATSIVLLAAYITGQPVLVSNHWSVFEYWVLAGAYILHLIEKFKKTETDCQVSFELCEMAAERALTALVDECARRSDLVQGFPLVDGHTYGARITILVGLLSAWDLFSRIRHRPRDKGDFVGSFLTARLREASVWGESAVPFLFLAALESEEHGRPRVAEGLAVQLIREISIHNGSFAMGRGIPNPYYSPEEALRLHYGLDLLNSEQFVGISYCVQPLIDFLARRWRRQALASLWFGVTRMSLTSFIPTTPAEWFRWRSSDGVLDSHLAGEPQSWESLRNGAETGSPQEVPQGLVERPAFALWFVLVYPHRFTPATAKLIEDALRESPN